VPTFQGMVVSHIW